MPTRREADNWQARWEAQGGDAPPSADAVRGAVRNFYRPLRGAVLPPIRQPAVPIQPLPETRTARELIRALLPGEAVLAWAQGKGQTLLVATDRRVLIAKVGVAATAQWFGRKVASFPYRQIGSVDLHAGLGDGYVQLLVPGQAQPQGSIGRYAQLVHADNICPFNRPQEEAFRAVVQVIADRLLY